jgi:hypothetical protein
MMSKTCCKECGYDGENLSDRVSNLEVIVERLASVIRHVYRANTCLDHRRCYDGNGNPRCVFAIEGISSDETPCKECTSVTSDFCYFVPVPEDE